MGAVKTIDINELDDLRDSVLEIEGILNVFCEFLEYENKGIDSNWYAVNAARKIAWNTAEALKEMVG